MKRNSGGRKKSGKNTKSTGDMGKRMGRYEKHALCKMENKVKTRPRPELRKKTRTRMKNEGGTSPIRATMRFLLDASSHLYKRPFPSVGPFVRRSER